MLRLRLQQQQQQRRPAGRLILGLVEPPGRRRRTRESAQSQWGLQSFVQNITKEQGGTHWKMDLLLGNGTECMSLVPGKKNETIFYGNSQSSQKGSCPWRLDK